MDGGLRRRRPDRSTTPTVEKVGGALDFFLYDRCSSLAVGCAFRGDSRDLVTQGTVSGPSPCCCVMPSWCTRACDSVRPRRSSSRLPGRSHRRRPGAWAGRPSRRAARRRHRIRPPRRAGLAIHLGAVLGPGRSASHIDRSPAKAPGPRPPRRHQPRADRRRRCRTGQLRTRPGTRPVVVQPGGGSAWTTPWIWPCSSTPHQRTPEPLRRARNLPGALELLRPAGALGPEPERAVDSVHAMCFAAESAHLAVTTGPERVARSSPVVATFPPEATTSGADRAPHRGEVQA